ncbi:hypothetical protein CPLU01_14047 [Colletotrichum plurivorum]|uniref:Uncharacterized protein n=1 Tax=Colletotrichum plurivorum TaxID=2175906 RepID=A0A8H6JM66_9PEZI|nr:hypothetical protein CPLU01_14047 [Colletotrichum plurivorum]
MVPLAIAGGLMTAIWDGYTCQQSMPRRETERRDESSSSSTPFESTPCHSPAGLLQTAQAQRRSKTGRWSQGAGVGEIDGDGSCLPSSRAAGSSPAGHCLPSSLLLGCAKFEDE